MPKKILPFLMVFAGLSLAGILISQFFWIQNAWRVQERDFREKSGNVLDRLVKELEEKENLSIISKRIIDSDEDTGLLVRGEEYKIDIAYDLISDDSLENFIVISDEGMPHQVLIEENIKAIKSEDVKVDILSNIPGRAFYSRSKSGDTSRHAYIYSKGSGRNDSVFVIINGITKQIKTKANQLEGVFEKLVMEVQKKPLDIGDRIDSDQLERILESAIRDEGLPDAFSYAVYSNGKTLESLPGSPDFKASDTINAVKRLLFPTDILNKADYIFLSFPGKRFFLMKTISGLLLLSAVFSVFVCLSFALVLKYLLKQKKLSEMKTDFINNMTHEFKTPIATISLASDTLKRKQKGHSDKDSEYLLNIISEENKRMDRQVERVLQMALIENKESFDPVLQKSDIHKLINEAKENINLKLKKKSASLECFLSAENSIIMADNDHLINVIYNLIDNSLKYSGNEPRIIIKSLNKANNLELIFKDNGTGMSASVRAHIFDKFYRKPQGDKHNTKGFGLGLSYVKSIVEKHGGSISVESQEGYGTSFKIIFPLA